MNFRMEDPGGRFQALRDQINALEQEAQRARQAAANGVNLAPPVPVMAPLAGINAHRRILADNIEHRLNIAIIISTVEYLTSGDKALLHDLLLKYPEGELTERWVNLWYSLFFDGDWISTIKPAIPILYRRTGTESAVIVGTLKEDCPLSIQKTRKRRCFVDNDGNEYYDFEAVDQNINNVCPIPNRRCGAIVQLQVYSGLFGPETQLLIQRIQ
ncbi:hypothetical protein EAF04_004436 [Stromatinia cepivora]|nr:hypothetical protein EAF04_004436 [Stromatinia cepivora]